MKIVVPNTLQRYNNMITASTLNNLFAFPDWSSSLYFYQGNMAVYNGNLYRCLEFNEGKQPDKYSDFWYLYGAWDNNTEQRWSASTNYSVGDLVTHISGYKYYIYRAMYASTGKVPVSNPDVWQNIGAVNINRCLIGATQNKTEQLGGFSITIDANRADYFYMLGVNAQSAQIEVLDSNGTVINDISESLTYKNSASWKQYYFKDFSYKRTFGSTIALGYGNSIRFSVSSYGIARVGDVVVGKSFYIGETLFGATSGIIDFSKKIRDGNFGDVSLEQGNYANRSDMTVNVDTPRADAVKNFLTEIRGQEVLILGDERDDGFDMLKIRGFVRDFSILLSNSVKTELSIQIEGLI